MQNTVVIIGAGPAGLTLACLLGQAGVPCTVVDQYLQTLEKPRDDNRTAALLRPSALVLHRAGITPETLEGTAPLETLSLIDLSAREGDTAQNRFDFKSSEINEPYFGLNIKNSVLHQALLKRAIGLPSVSIIAPAAISDMTSSSKSIIVHTDQGNIEGAIVIGADGRTSKVRDLSGMPTDKIDYEQTAITCTCTHTLPHNNTSIEFHRPGGPFTLVPLAGGLTSSVVWMERTPHAGRYLSMSADDFKTALQEQTRNVLGTITNVTRPQSWPIILLKVQKLTAHRVALMAEAAHVIPPSGAQGLNLSLRDADDLAHILITAYRTGGDLGSPYVLSSYERARWADLRPRLWAVDGLNRLILSSHPVLQKTRRIGLATLAGVPFLRHMIMKFGWAPG